MFHVILSTSPFWHLLLSLQKVVVCYLCGESGHSGNKCSNPICYNCNKPGHVASDCTGPRRSRYIDCHRCQMLGHTSYVSCNNFFLIVIQLYSKTLVTGIIKSFTNQEQRLPKSVSLYQTFSLVKTPFHQTEQNFTGPKKDQAFPAVVAFNPGLPIFHFSF